MQRRRVQKESDELLYITRYGPRTSCQRKEAKDAKLPMTQPSLPRANATLRSICKSMKNRTIRPIWGCRCVQKQNFPPRGCCRRVPWQIRQTCRKSLKGMRD